MAKKGKKAYYKVGAILRNERDKTGSPSAFPTRFKYFEKKKKPFSTTSGVANRNGEPEPEYFATTTGTLNVTQSDFRSIGFSYASLFKTFHTE